jgi:hypothetical protein
MADEGVFKYSDFPLASQYLVPAHACVTADGVIYPWSDPMTRLCTGYCYERTGEDDFYVYLRVTDKHIEVFRGTTGIHELDTCVKRIKLP